MLTAFVNIMIYQKCNRVEENPILEGTFIVGVPIKGNLTKEIVPGNRQQLQIEGKVVGTDAYGYVTRVSDGKTVINLRDCIRYTIEATA